MAPAQSARKIIDYVQCRIDTRRESNMERILDKIEAAIEKQLNDLETAPVKTSIKLFIWFWIAKTIWKEIKR